MSIDFLVSNVRKNRMFKRRAAMFDCLVSDCGKITHWLDRRNHD
jgi:hypothetical protein